MTSVNLDPETLSPALATFAKKIAAGKKGTTDWQTATEFLSRLPGWKVQNLIAPMALTSLRKLTYFGTFKGTTKVARLPQPVSGPYNDMWSFNRDTVRDGKVTTAELKGWSYMVHPNNVPLIDLAPTRAALHIGSLPTQVEEDGIYAETCEVKKVDLYTDYPATLVYLGKVHYGVRAMTITAPDGKSVVVFDDPQTKGEFGSGPFYTWVKKTSFYADAKNISSALQPSKEREDEIRLGGTLDESGVCAICERRQKMHHTGTKKPLMYDHGYQVPRHGWVARVGSCYGAGFPPSEVSSRALVEYIQYLKENRVKIVKMLANQKVATSISRAEPDRSAPRNRYGERPTKMVTYTRESPEWPQLLANAVAQLEQSIASIDEERPVYEQALREWKRKPTYDESKAGKLFYTAVEPAAAPAVKEVMNFMQHLDD